MQRSPRVSQLSAATYATLKQVARHLGISLNTARSLAQRGMLPAVKVGRQWRINLEVLERWMHRQMERQTVARRQYTELFQK